MRRNEKHTWLVRLLAAASLAATFGYLPYHLYTRSGLARYLALREELQVLHAKNARFKAENDELARQAEALKTDLRAVERVARVELGWVRPGEVVFDLGQEP